MFLVFDRRIAMATCEQIRDTAKKTEPSGLHPGCLTLIPSVWLTHLSTGAVVAAWILDENSQTVLLKGHDRPFPAGEFRVCARQGRISNQDFSGALWVELEEFLFRVAEERVDGPASVPTQNAQTAASLLKRIFDSRREPAPESACQQ